MGVFCSNGPHATNKLLREAYYQEMILGLQAYYITGITNITNITYYITSAKRYPITNDFAECAYWKL